jgi:Holliday junction DNA helicase RuvA
MIGRLRGMLVETGESDLLMDVGGVGYVVACGARTLGRLPAPGEDLTLMIESQWSQENGPRLYGFLGKDERKAFTTLIAIQGVGPKAALAVLDVCRPASWPVRRRARTRRRSPAPTASGPSWPSASSPS